MEYRRDSLNMVKMCRFCLAQNNSLECLYDRDRPGKNSVNLHLKILSCVSIEIFPSDKMPTFICSRCKFFMNLFYEYKQIVRQADETILQYVQHNSPMEIVTWPSSLSNVFLTASDVKIVETVEGGATVQVSSQDNFDSDEEDGNVYNIKIGDGSPDETKTACVKVITRKDGKEMKQVIEDPNIKDKEPADISEKNLDGRWACDECDCTYPLQQLLELHKSQKHRERTEECELCGLKFFTRYDLNAHQVRHSYEMPFQCGVCDKKFKRLFMLKRHEKIVHSDLPQQVCSNCPASFLTIEDLKEHKKKHIRLLRPYVCNICDKKFHEKNTLQRHILVIHNKAPTYCCEYCPERFVSVSKLTRHVRTHAGTRSYPCKYCDKSFTKSHHCTRHIRQIHPNRTAFPEREYRCEQCSDSFATQDELIYHSAIHATQNLTCPLCQEKFPDVDAVTAHIKSHANGVAFMCDYCELVFTTKDKLDIHQLNVHEEEMQSEMCQDDSSMEMENEEDEEDDNSINVKQDGEHMIIEIKKPNEFMINDIKEETDDKPDVTNSEESGSEIIYSDVTKVATPSRDLVSSVLKKNPVKILEDKSVIIKPAFKREPTKLESKPNEKPTIILQKVEEMKQKPSQQATDNAVTDKKKMVEEKSVNKIEGTNTGGASDKSLRLLEKELQDLKSTNSRSEMTKNPIKTNELFKNKRLLLHTSTPKLKVVEDKKLPAIKSPAPEKKLEKRITSKENKEQKEVKEAITRNNNGNNKEDKEKEKEIPKQSLMKNGSNIDKSNTDDSVRRSTRPSKIKNYAKMIRDRSQMKDGDDDEEDNDESTSEEDEEYKEANTSLEVRTKARRVSQTKSSPAPKPAPSTPAVAPRKRGRPRKFPLNEVPAKIKKDNEDTAEKAETTGQETSSMKPDELESEAPVESELSNQSISKIPEEQKDTSPDVIVSPTGQLKKIPVKAIPPGVKALPLPVNARPMTGEVCEMQIGKKVVKVQKIVMTKAEVEAMAKKGLVEMKDGTMVLKQGIKLPTVESSKISNLVSEETEKEAIIKDKATPTRCDLNDE